MGKPIDIVSKNWVYTIKRKRNGKAVGIKEINFELLRIIAEDSDVCFKKANQND